MRYVATSFGSAGDFLPTLAVARELCAAGHEVVFVTNPFHERAVRAAGLEYIGAGRLVDLYKLTHGGAGTTGETLKSGRPSVVCPLAFDQFGLAWQVEGLGTGVRVAKKGRLRATILAAVRTACEDEAMHGRADEVAAAQRQARDGAAVAAELIPCRACHPARAKVLKMSAVSPWLLPIESERLRLIPALAEHADAFADAALESHAELSQWSKRGSGDDRASYLQKALRRVAATAGGTFVTRYAFTREQPERLVGSVAMQAWRRPMAGVAEAPPDLRVGESPELELGYWCRTSLAGQGYASEAVLALVVHAFTDLGAAAIWLRIGEENARSRRLAERLAFIEVERVAFPASKEWGDAATVLFMRRQR